jgi:hypothetical protein
VRTAVLKLKTIPLNYVKTIITKLDKIVLTRLETVSKELHTKIEKVNKVLKVDGVQNVTKFIMDGLLTFTTGLVNFKSAVINGYWGKTLEMDTRCSGKIQAMVPFMCGKRDEKGPTDLKLFESTTNVMVNVRKRLESFVDNARLIVLFLDPLTVLDKKFPDLSIVEDILEPLEMVLSPLDISIMCPKSPDDWRRRRRRRLLMLEPPARFSSGSSGGGSSISGSSGSSSIRSSSSSNLVQVASSETSAAGTKTLHSVSTLLRGGKSKNQFIGLIACEISSSSVYKTCKTNRVSVHFGYRNRINQLARDIERKSSTYFHDKILHDKRDSFTGLLSVVTSTIFWELEAGPRGWQKKPRNCADEDGTCTCVGYVSYGTKAHRWGLKDITMSGGSIQCKESAFGKRPESMVLSHQEKSCTPYYCECTPLKDVNEQGWVSLSSTANEEGIGEDLNKLDSAAKWIDMDRKPEENCKEGQECTCHGYMQMGMVVNGEYQWWGTLPLFSTHDCPGGGGRGYSCKRLTCNTATFGDPFSNEKQGGSKRCRCLKVGVAKEEVENRPSYWSKACMGVFEEEISKKTHAHEILDVCNAVSDYLVSEERYASAILKQRAKQGNTALCCENEAWSAVGDAFKSIGNAIMGAFFFRSTVGGCLGYWMKKLTAVVGGILGPILRMLQFEKLFDPIKNVIRVKLSPIIDMFTAIKLPAIPKMPVTVDFPDMLEMQNGIYLSILQFRKDLTLKFDESPKLKCHL